MEHPQLWERQQSGWTCRTPGLGEYRKKSYSYCRGLGDGLKSYAVPWSGELILACRKCQKKLKGDAELGELAKLKKAVKRYNKTHPQKALTVLNVPCMDLCPKGGVTVCVASERPSRLRILRGVGEIGELVGGETH